jgi:uncharacterized protein (TIRG00374 family)
MVGVLLGALLLILVGRGIEWAAVADALRQASGPDLLLGLASILAFMVTKALRWRHLVSPFAGATTWQLLPAVFAGTAGNSLVPHAGELVRVVVARRRVAAETSTLMGTIAVERMLDFIALLVIALAVLVPLGAMTESVQAASWVLAALGGGILAAALLVTFRTESVVIWLEGHMAQLRPALRDRVLREVRLGAEGLGSLRQPRLLAVVLALSIAQWLLIAATIFFSLRAVSSVTGLVAVTSVLLMSVVGVTLPTAPGYVGTVQAAFVLGLAPFGVGAADAVAASVVYNLLIIVPIWLVALPYLQGHLRHMIEGRGTGTA